MKVLLNSDVQKVGYRGDIVEVKRGYFMNFLYPNNFAIAADDKTIALAEKRNESRVVQKKQVLDNAKEILEKLKGLSITLSGKVSDKGHLYGSITEADIVEAVKKSAKVELEKEFLKMDHLKDLGEHKVIVHLGDKLEQEITVVIEAEA